MSSSAFADDVLIELSPEQPYVDLPITVETPSTVTVTTTTGDPRALGFIDSWVEIWQDTIRLGYNDDGGHTATNYLASLLSLPLDAGTYFIKATSYAWAVTNGNQTPTGNYTLTWSGAVLASPTPTPTVTPTETPTPEPTPSPVETESPTPSPTPEPSQETTPLPIPEPVIDNSDNEEILSVVTPETLPTPEPTPTLEPEPEITEQIIEPETIATPVLEPELSVEELEEQMQEQIIQEYIAENTLELDIPTALAEIPGIAEVFAATEAILNVGSDMTPEQREESQGVVIAAVLVQQIAQISAVGAMSRRNK
jgi:hypothetical protein